ncbi:lipoprotein [Isorropodon fossajaponicum endosymbiont JTNG4]|uniref:hypothetical protein n=1 Tax=Isorropodon fossajaponicum symbiont TaxID=883811 RepID=UPI001915FB12|nr:hypothetical protein [Isorropodon fossajaponicum symbiont]BBB23457.1 lipoprotein [Isorropodon fossajaponicum endosymbiont JTNG4]
MKLLTSLAVLSALTLTGCNTSSSHVMADNMDGYEFSNMNCEEIRAELLHLQYTANNAAEIVDDIASSQDSKNVAAFLLFWPALFLIEDNSLEARKYAQIKGKYEAAKRIYRRKGCKTTIKYESN